MSRASCCLILAFLVLRAAPAGATTYTVTNTSDSDPGSLRDAIAQANLNPPGPHRIVFAIAGVGVQTIHLLSTLDDVQNPTALDATTQPGYNGVPLIELDGSDVSGGLHLDAAHSSVKGFVLNRFADTALGVAADACTVSACYIGTNAAGTAASPNAFFGVFVTGNDCMVGGRFPADRNVISGNTSVGAVINSAARDSVIGNYVGTDVTGTVAIPNGTEGVESDATTRAVVDGNVISGNLDDGIYVDSSTQPAPTDGLRITRNLIGTDASGRHAIPNQMEGILLLSSYTIVGDVGRGNVISGNGDFGIFSDGAFFPSHNQILGNKIGVSADGTQAIGNTAGGIYLHRSLGNIVGVSRSDGSGNLIAANGGPGISIDEVTATDNLIQGNAIGTSFNGAAALGNAGAGINAASDRATIGGSGLAGNVIAHNHGGVYVGGVQNPIEGNAIFQNGPGLGIDLTQPALGVTPNDSLDLDEGANHLQNFPVIVTASVLGSQVQLVGQLSSSPSHPFTLDFYSNRQCSSSGYGEGESWAGQLVATTDASGNIGFVIMIPLSSVVGYVFTATATDDAGSTSEFSHCVSVSEPTAVEAEPGVSYALGQTRPMPAVGRASLPFSLARPSHVRVSAYDVSGRLVARLVDRDLPAGPQRAEWSLAGLAAGTYFCRLEASANDGSGQHFRASSTVVVVR